MGNLFYGKTIAQEIQNFVREEISNVRKLSQQEPVMVTIKIEQQDSLKMAEVKLHSTIGNQLGITVHEIILAPLTSESQLIQIVQECNADSSIHGLLVLLPLPEHIDPEKVLSAISPEKELEGLHENKIGKQSNVLAALLRVSDAIKVPIFQMHCVFMADEFALQSNAVTRKVLERARTLGFSLSVTTSKADRVKKVTQKADLLAVSLQTPGIIDKKYIKQDAIVMDFDPILAGEKYCEKKGSMVPVLKSSLDIDSLLTKAKYIFPAIGGIRPIALANLMRNFLLNYKAACEV